MSRASEPGAKLISSYRAATSMRADQRERALRKLQARLAADPTPRFHPDVAVPELPSPPPAAWLQLRARWRRVVTISKVTLGAALLTWLATDPDEQPARVASPAVAAPQQPRAATTEALSPLPAQSAPSLPESRVPPSSPDRARKSGASKSRVAQVETSVRAPAVPEGTGEQPASVTMRQSDWPAARPAAHAPLDGRVPERGAQQLLAATLEQETALMEQAQAALKRGDAERALHLLAEHTWQFPAGHLAEARDVARILALCQAGHDAQARTRAKSFLAARPHSPFAARVRTSCPDAK
jgi:hypothetical protein